MKTRTKLLILVGAIVGLSGLMSIALVSDKFKPSRYQYASVNATVAPGFHLDAIPWNADLDTRFMMPDASIKAFDVTTDMPLISVFSYYLLEMPSGRALTSAGDLVSAAYIHHSVVALTAEGQLGYLTQDGMRYAGYAPFGAARVAATSDHQELFLLRDDSPYGLGILRGNGQAELLSGSPDKIVTVAGTYGAHVFAVDQDLFYQTGALAPMLILHLPNKEGPFLGLAMDGDVIYFSTASSVHVIQGALAIPLVIGVGGNLALSDKGLIVLNAKNSRFYLLRADN